MGHTMHGTLWSGKLLPNCFIVTTHPHIECLAFQEKSDRTLENTGEYAMACEDAAQEAAVPVLNLWEVHI